jgi:Ca2+-binding RTX toxin-like protein
MTDFNFSNLRLNFDSAANLAELNLGTQLQPTSWIWTNPTNNMIQFLSHALTFDGNNLPASGTFYGMRLKLNGSSNSLSSPDLNVTNLNIDATLFAGMHGLGQSEQNNLFWRLLTSGDDGFYFGTLATDQAFEINLAGDGRDVLSGETIIGGNDAFGGDFGDGRVEGDFTNVLSGATAFGGDDSFYVTGDVAIGDTDSVAGFLSGGNDTLEAAAGEHVETFVGDAMEVQASGLLIGGDDLITFAGVGGSYGYGDAYSINGTVIAGNDTIIGGDGADSHLVGDVGYLFAGATLRAGHDVIYGRAGNDHIYGDSTSVGDPTTVIWGNDSLHGGAGRDTVEGNGGHDVLYVDAVSDDAVGEVYDGGDGNDTLLVGLTNGGEINLADDSIVDIETLKLTTATGTVIVHLNSSQVLGRSYAGTDNDAVGEVIAVDLGAMTTLDLGALSTSLLGNDDDYFLITGDSDVEIIVGAQNAANSIDAGGNDDYLIGGSFDDTIGGGAGMDNVQGGSGDDIFVLNEGDLVAGESYDGGSYTVGNAFMFQGTDGSYTFDLRTGITLNAINQLGLFSASTGGGGSGSIVVTAAQMAAIGFIGADPMSADFYATIAVDMTGTSNLDMSGIDATAFGGPRHTVIINGNVGSETITGSAANDSIVSGGGVDVLAGGGGNDMYELWDSSTVTITEAANAGYDTIISTSNRTLAANVDELILQTGAVTGTGNAIANRIVGNTAANTLDGGAGAGNDTLVGDLGNDTYIVRKATDVVQEAAANMGTADHVQFLGTGGTYTLTAFVEKLTLGGSSAISGTGNTLANTIVGNTKANTLSGMTGNDTVTGGLGADKFVFSTALNKNTNVDRIMDLNHGQGDKIHLDNSVMAALGSKTGSLGTQFYAASGATNGKDANDHIVYNTKTGELRYDSNGSGAGGTTLIAMLHNKAALVAADFAIV